MNKTELVSKIKQIQNTLAEIIQDIETGKDRNYIKDILKQQSMELYRHAANIENTGTETHTTIASGSPEKPEDMREEKMAEKLQKAPEPIAPEPVIHTEIKPEVHPIAAESTETIKAPPVHINPVPELNQLAEANAIKTKQQPKKPAEQTDEDEELSLNERFLKSKAPASNFAEKSKESPIKDLSKAISISKKFEFINGLFNGKADQYKACIETVQHADSYETAITFVETAADQDLWDENEKLAAEFFSLIRRRFNR